MVRAEIPHGHEVRMEETHMVTYNTKSHRHEPPKDQEVKRGRTVAKRYNIPSWIQSPEPKARRAWAQPRTSCFFEFAFITLHGHSAWMDHMQRPSTPKAKGQNKWQIQPDLPSVQ